MITYLDGRVYDEKTEILGVNIPPNTQHTIIFLGQETRVTFNCPMIAIVNGMNDHVSDWESYDYIHRKQV